MLGQSCAILVAGSKWQRGSSSRGRCLILLSLIDPGQTGIGPGQGVFLEGHRKWVAELRFNRSPTARQ